MDELKPCPFCGSGALYETWRNGYLDETPTMFCNSCKAVVTWEQVEEEGVNDETRTFVREHWNTRAERTCRMTDRGECSECGAYIVRAWTEVHDFNGDMKRIDLRSHNYCPNCGAKVVSE